MNKTLTGLLFLLASLTTTALNADVIAQFDGGTYINGNSTGASSNYGQSFTTYNDGNADILTSFYFSYAVNGITKHSDIGGSAIIFSSEYKGDVAKMSDTSPSYLGAAKWDAKNECWDFSSANIVLLPNTKYYVYYFSDKNYPIAPGKYAGGNTYATNNNPPFFFSAGTQAFNFVATGKPVPQGTIASFSGGVYVNGSSVARVPYGQSFTTSNDGTSDLLQSFFFFYDENGTVKHSNIGGTAHIFSSEFKDKAASMSSASTGYLGTARWNTKTQCWDFAESNIILAPNTKYYFYFNPSVNVPVAAGNYEGGNISNVTPPPYYSNAKISFNFTVIGEPVQ
jgi:hypothetical protein